jgi:hypothetical protein
VSARKLVHVIRDNCAVHNHPSCFSDSREDRMNVTRILGSRRAVESGLYGKFRADRGRRPLPKGVCPRTVRKWVIALRE